MSFAPDHHFGKKYLLGDCLLDPDRRLIVCDGDQVHLANKPFQVLLYLIDNRDRVVSRQELLEQFWDGKEVYDDTLRKAVGAIRKALGERSAAARFIETRHREGYRYVGPLEEEANEGAHAALEIEKTRGVRIVIEEEDTPSPDRPTAPAGHPELSQTAGRKRHISALGLTSICLV